MNARTSRLLRKYSTTSGRGWHRRELKREWLATPKARRFGVRKALLYQMQQEQS